ncbi:TraB/GumN family protein [Simiduia curdlanivorans]|uniref:TraB/GumN family protein n=1 Tax=Simiduia curdlanivorans TaxID=1492769 RepID=A0ABV8V1N1_9GAMM|nr:TraB/GumN family protein [Simiduia curdlanivorans]MDN3640026.1 TraB/GumN family protein [Simiduia curdlanivorans]
MPIPWCDKLMKPFAVFFILLSLVFSTPLLAGARPSVWLLESARGNIVLLGSIHVGDESFYPFDDAVEQAFETASALVVELDVTALDGAEVAAAIRKLGMFDDQQLQNKQGLSSVLTPGAQQALAVFCRGDLKVHCPPEAQMEAMQPWFLGLHFATAMLANSGFQTQFGVDSYFLRRAKDKDVIELESFTQQMQAFSGLDARAQSDFLSQSLMEFNSGSDKVTELVDAWRHGDDDALRLLVLEPMVTAPEGQAIYRALFQRRNFSMVEKLMGQVRVGESLFVVVGAGHLLGQEGLLSLLRAKGFIASKF